MSAELTALVLAALLQVAQLMLAGWATSRDAGGEWAAGPRDEAPSLSPLAGRLRRALQNHFEGLILFTIAVVVVTLSDQGSAVTVACAYLYLAARILFVPAYAFGWSPGRSIIWGVGFVATLTMLVASLI